MAAVYGRVLMPPQGGAKSDYIHFVQGFHEAHPNMSWRECVKMASAEYHKIHGKGEYHHEKLKKHKRKLRKAGVLAGKRRGGAKSDYFKFVKQYQMEHNCTWREAVKMASPEYHKLNGKGEYSHKKYRKHKRKLRSAGRYYHKKGGSKREKRKKRAGKRGYFDHHDAHVEHARKGWHEAAGAMAGGPISDLHIPIISSVASLFGLGMNDSSAIVNEVAKQLAMGKHRRM
jgi:hypothetical protein